MKREVREASGGWDDLPPGAKVVGRRRPSPAAKAGYGIQKLANELSGKRIGWPKGVYRFKSHEEADAWWTETMKIMDPYERLRVRSLFASAEG